MFKLLNSLLWIAFILILLNGYGTGHWRYLKCQNGAFQKAFFVVAPGAHLWTQQQDQIYWQVSPWQEYQAK